MRLYLLGRFNSTGGGRHAENFYRGLLGLKIQNVSIISVDPDDKPALARMLLGGTAEDIGIFFDLTNPQLVEKFKGRKILWFVFESNRLPSKVLALLGDYDQLWVPSLWGYNILVAHGVSPTVIRIVPEGVDPLIYYPHPSPHDGFIFLSVGKYEKRKALDELVAAFIEEFPLATHPKVKLWLKADHPLFPERLLELKTKTDVDKRIQVIGGDYPEADLLKLYRCADAFAFPSRAEGFGLPGLEAIACGLPLLTVNYSGQTEYLKEIENLFYPIDYALVPLRDRDFQSFYKEAFGGEDFGTWAEPDRRSLARALRDIYDNISLWRPKAIEASERIRIKFAWTTIARGALEALKH